MLLDMKFILTNFNANGYFIGNAIDAVFVNDNSVGVTMEFALTSALLLALPSVSCEPRFY